MSINSVKVIQQILGLTDKQFAQEIGIHEKSWNRIKKGHSRLTPKLEARIKSVYKVDDTGFIAGDYYLIQEYPDKVVWTIQPNNLINKVKSFLRTLKIK